MARLALATVLVTLFTTALSRRDPSNTCVSSFWPNDTRWYFNECKTQLCFTFLVEEPYVNPSEKLSKTAPLKPFRCLDHAREYHGLDGLFFDILRGLSDNEEEGVRPSIRDALCVYGGPTCTFDDEIRFVHDAVGVGDKHQFIAGGALLYMEHRRTNLTFHSQPWFTDSIVLLHRPEFARHSFPSAFRQIFQPFKGTGWVVVTIFSFLLCFGLAAHVFRFSRARRPQALLRWFFQNQREPGIWELATWNVQKITVVVFFSVLLLLYEISVVNFVLQGPDAVVDNIDQLKELGLDRFTMGNGSVSETIFKYAIGRGHQTSASETPWQRASDLKQMFDSIMKNPARNNTVRYIFTFASIVRNYLSKRNLCNEITVTSLEKTLAGGWYYGASVDPSTRVRLDKGLSVLELMDVPRKKITAYGVVPIDCGEKLAHKVGHEVLLILLTLTVGPLIALYLFFMLLSFLWKDVDSTNTPQRRQQRPDNNAAEDWRVSDAVDSFISSDDAVTGVTPSTSKD